VFRLCALALPASLGLFLVADDSALERPGFGRGLPGALPVSGDASLWDLGPFLLAQEGRVGAAVVDTRRGVVFRQNAAEPHVLASVAKVYILIAYLDLLGQEQREPTPQELEQMEFMIEWSDNPSASDLWDVIGRSEGLDDFLQRKGLPRVEAPAEEAYWGDMRASALDVANVLARLYNGSILDETNTALALDLLASVIEDQTWGVGTARAAGEELYLKNGWYPEEEGWVVNSVGIATSAQGDYVVALLADSQPSFETGVTMIETAVLYVRLLLLEHRLDSGGSPFFNLNDLVSGEHIADPR
jgi:beta-lactamase class A